MSNVIRWYKSVEMDAPELKSPQPCPRGVHCDYRVEVDHRMITACCRFVHPGEEGNGRRIFPARQVKETGAEAGFYEQPACVRLTGGAGFYERRRLRLSWGEWCEKMGIPYTPIKAGEHWEPVTLGPIGGRGPRPKAAASSAAASSAAASSAAASSAAQHKPTKNQRKRMNKKGKQETSEPQRPPPLNLSPQFDLSYGFNAMEGLAFPRPRRHSYTESKEDDDEGCSTPSLLTPICSSDVEIQIMAKEGGMEAVD